MNSDLEKKIQEISDYIYQGNDLIFPISVISTKLKNLEERIYNCERKIDDIYSNNAKMHNKVIYMFLTLLCTVLGKSLIQYLTG